MQKRLPGGNRRHFDNLPCRYAKQITQAGRVGVPRVNASQPVALKEKSIAGFWVVRFTQTGQSDPRKKQTWSLYIQPPNRVVWQWELLGERFQFDYA
jgi:hypothetical protein